MYIENKTIAALETDIRRGLQEMSGKDGRVVVEALLWWRFIHINPRWPFVLSGPPQLLMTIKQPAKLVEWIDAAIVSAGASADLLKQRFQSAVAEAAQTALRTKSDKK
jgi:hypothetical protein